MSPARPKGNRPNRLANDAEREARTTEIIVRLERLLAEAAKLREKLARVKGSIPLSQTQHRRRST